MILYRPVGSAELKLIEESGFNSFPPRLPEQPMHRENAGHWYIMARFMR